MSTTAELASTTAKATVSESIEERAQRVFATQQATALRLRHSTVAQRIEKLQRLRNAILSHQQQITAAAAADFGRSSLEADFTEIMPVLMEISDYCKHLKKWLRPQKAKSSLMMFGTRSKTQFEPRGRCLIIAPWNYPVTLTLGPLVPAIASGNTVMIKTSEMAPNFSKALVNIIESAFEEDEIAIFEGEVNVATALLELPFDHMFFTGAPNIGKVVMTAAAKHLSSVTLELGGKSPIIVDESANLTQAAQTIAWGKYVNNGQTCIAPDHIYVHDSVKTELVAIMSKALSDWYGEGEKAQQSDVARIINRRHTDRVHDLLQDAVNRGAKVLYGGATDLENRFISPTLLSDIPSEARIMEEEIFGPLLPIISYSDLNEVIDTINNGPKPLALYLWSKNKRQVDHIIQSTSAGGTCVNNVMAHFLNQNLPFGGVNNSGIGSYHGKWGVQAFSHERAILETTIFTSKLFFPPAMKKLGGVLQWLIPKL